MKPGGQVRNNNSSRFGKWSEIQFDPHAQMCGWVGARPRHDLYPTACVGNVPVTQRRPPLRCIRRSESRPDVVERDVLFVASLGRTWLYATRYL